MKQYVDRTTQQLSEIGMWNPEKAADLYVQHKNANAREKEALEQHINILHQIVTWVKE